ncbi:ATP-binding protein [Nitrosomonas communis]|uniref:Serine/threonine-protein kinase RsbW/sigma-B regulation protein RsbU (Phosphoserine phosphatase) n=1 Tax=Nitrosomonas communis TaxID=44574 RepID=A0A1I4Q2K6_9PROT|nr:ATP-binding protein [Nitrosomonas communis]SFM34234.1 serine/threonine-protein kinase RsbW/sigma-B regulation protein RsbU (phosphoserine phosphatase) [Nitrosomonas communis]
MKSNKPPQIKESKPKESHVCENNKEVLLDCRVPARLEEIEKLADAVNKALSDPDLAFSVNLCLEELITNTILHGLKCANNRFIHVRMSVSNEWLEILLKDDAPQYDPFKQAPKPNLDLDINERPVGGLGVHIVKKLMDDVQAYYDGTGNLIILLKKLHQLSPE